MPAQVSASGTAAGGSRSSPLLGKATPGLIGTEGLAVYPPEAAKEWPRANPMKRWGSPWDIAQACAWIAGPAGNFVTGEVCTVDGGGRLWGELWTAGRPPWFET